MNKPHNLQVFKNATALAEATREYIIALATQTVASKGRFVIALSGGKTPELLYSLLAEPQLENQMPWHRTFVFWADERCVPQTDERNNAYTAKTLLLNHVGIPSENINPIPISLTPAVAATTYEETIIKYFDIDTPRFDLILLGLGKDGHTASLFPNSNAIADDSLLVTEVYEAEQEIYRITMTPNLINKAFNILFLVAGSDKAEILSKVIANTNETDLYPAQLIKPIDGNLHWFVDNDAAADLRK